MRTEVCYEIGPLKVSLQGAGNYSTNVDVDSDFFGLGNWIGFYALSDSHAVMGTATIGANNSNIEVTLLPDPSPNVPQREGIALFSSGVCGLFGLRVWRERFGKI